MLTRDWRAAFWVTAAIGLVALVAWLLVARETPARHPWTGDAERRYIEAGLPAETLRATGDALVEPVIAQAKARETAAVIHGR